MTENVNRFTKNSASLSGIAVSDNMEMKARYERAQSLVQGIWTNTVALNSTVFPNWIGQTDCFWYAHDNRVGHGPTCTYSQQYRLVNADEATSVIAFDHQVLADELAQASQQKVDVNALPLSKIDMVLNNKKEVRLVEFTAFGKRWEFDTVSCRCKEIRDIVDGEVISPDGRYIVFRKDFNLWVREAQTGFEHVLTSDGEEQNVYGAVGSAWGVEIDDVGGLQVIWSPDSKRVFAVQRDTRRVKDLPIVSHVPDGEGLRPTLQLLKVAFPGDKHIEELRLVAIEVVSSDHSLIGKLQSAKYNKIPVTRNGLGFFNSKLGWWHSDSRRAYFVDMRRDYKKVRIVEFDTDTGDTKILFEEKSDTQINLALNGDEPPTFLPLPESSEVIWFSERSGWAHIYLYDLNTGQLKHPVTEGEWVMRNIISFDPIRREIFVQTAGRVANRDPYYRDLVRVNIDTGELVTLITGDYEIVCNAPIELMSTLGRVVGLVDGMSNGVSPLGNYAVVTCSRADTVPVSRLIDRDGKDVLELVISDVSHLPSGWQWPEPVQLMAADGSTDIYGLVYRPSNFSSANSYPIVSHTFNTPDFPWSPKGSFTNDKWLGWPYLDAAAIAELGFIVVQIDGRGASFRNKAFMDESYGCLELASKLEDQIAGIRALADRYPYMDVNRVGIIAPFGGPGPVQALLRHPDFYKVGICNIFHDPRLMPAAMWSERSEGLSGPAEGYQYAEELVESLEGKLLLMGGMLDDAVPASIFRLVEALQTYGKDFDLKLLPNLAHWGSSYLMRQSWDYLVRHLLEAEPPKEFPLSCMFGGNR